MRKVIAAFTALIALVLLTAASSQSSKTSTSTSLKPAVVMMGDDMRFSPAKVVVHRGQMVAWQSLSKQIHNVVDVPEQSPRPGVMTLPKGAATFDSGLMQYGQTYTQTFTVPGTYKYACSLHIANGMVGQIVVK